MRRVFQKISLNEISGAAGDLGTLLPLAFALVAINGFPPERLFLLWGVVYIFTGLYFEVPVAVQPLKAMAVIALAKGFSVEMLSVSGFFYGILLLLLSLTGLINLLKKVFTPGIVRGIELGIGLILAQKAVELVFSHGILLGLPLQSITINIILLAAAVVVIFAFQIKNQLPVGIILILLSIIYFYFTGGSGAENNPGKNLIAFTNPDFSKILDAFIFLIIPQIPLTLGNSIYAADDICHSIWGERAKKVSASKLGLSIGISDAAIGLLGGFPICHGAGGMAAHDQFGAKTGTATIILGSFLVLISLAGFSSFLFLIPVSLLSAMLVYNSFRMIILIKKVEDNIQLFTALLVGLISFATTNLSIALGTGIIFEFVYKFFVGRKLLELKLFKK